MENKIERKNKKSEMLLWSIALPGFGQLLNGKFMKGIVLIFLEFLINMKASLNAVIVYSFHGEIAKATLEADYQWLMFYPCVYMFAIWDAYKDAGGGEAPFSFLPFVFAAYTGTIGVIYSARFTLFGVVLGPVWLPIISLVLGVFIGLILKVMFNRINVRKRG